MQKMIFGVLVGQTMEEGGKIMEKRRSEEAIPLLSTRV